MTSHGKYWEDAVRLAIEFLEADEALELAKRIEDRADSKVNVAQATYREAMRRVESAQEAKVHKRRLLEGSTDNPEEMTDAIREARRLRALERKSKRR